MVRKADAKKPGAAPFAAPSWPAVNAKLWKLAKIVPYPNNPRVHPPAEIKLLADMMKRHGVDQPIVVDEKGVIIKGHGRLEAAKLAGFHDFPVAQHFGLSDADKMAMRIADNAVPLLAGWDRELLRAELSVLKHYDFALDTLGFGQAELVQFTTSPLPPGQFQQVGENLPTEFCCPACGHKWSGNPKAGEAKPAKAKDKKGGAGGKENKRRRAA